MSKKSKKTAKRAASKKSKAKKTSKKAKVAASAKAKRVSTIGLVRGFITADPSITTSQVRVKLEKALVAAGVPVKSVKTIDSHANPTGLAVLVARARHMCILSGAVRKEQLPTAGRPLGCRQMAYIPNAKSLSKKVGVRKGAGGAAGTSPQKTKAAKAKAKAKAKRAGAKKVAKKSKRAGAKRAKRA